VTSCYSREWRPGGAEAATENGGQAEQELQQGMAARRSKSYSRGWRPGRAGAIVGDGSQVEQELQQKLRQRGDDRRPMLGGATQ
jgi:hypothetical protein